MKRIDLVLVLVPVLGLGACDIAPQATLTPGFGDTVRHNIAAQTVNPAPPPETPTMGDGKRAGAAWQRYSDGQVRQPPRLGTSDVTQGGAGK